MKNYCNISDGNHKRFRREVEDENLKKIKQAMVLHSVLKKIINEGEKDGMCSNKPLNLIHFSFYHLSSKIYYHQLFCHYFRLMIYFLFS